MAPRAPSAVLLASLFVLGTPAAGDARSRPPTVLRIAPPPGASLFGAAVAGLGDVDGAGGADVVVGAPGSERAYVFSGATRAMLHEIADPRGSGSAFGSAVAGIGDIDGDSTADVVVGAPSDPLSLPPPCPTHERCEGSDPGPGRAFVFSGNSGALLRELRSPAADDRAFGRSVAAGGDLSRDGVPDVLVGAPARGARPGTVFAFSGANGDQLWSRTEPPEAPERSSSFGDVVVATPDLSDDGVPDVLVPAPSTASSPEMAGRVHVMSGVDGTVVRSISDPAPHPDDGFAAAVAPIGDQDGDGVVDQLVSEGGANQLQLYSGDDGRPMGSITAPGDAHAQRTIGIAPVDDKDGDGRDDLWLGVPSTRTISLVNAMGTTLASATAPTAEAGLGASVSAVGNVGGDVGADLVAGDPTDPAGGAAYLVHTRQNQRPVADAGNDQVVESGLAGASVTLDGSGSSDTDGDALSYEWWENGRVLASTAVARVRLPAGRHRFILAVRDVLGDGHADTVVVIVAQTAPPPMVVAPITESTGAAGEAVLAPPAEAPFEPATSAVTSPANPATARLPKRAMAATPSPASTPVANASATATLPKPAEATVANDALARTGGGPDWYMSAAGLVALLLGRAGMRVSRRAGGPLGGRRSSGGE